MTRLHRAYRIWAAIVVALVLLLLMLTLWRQPRWSGVEPVVGMILVHPGSAPVCAPDVRPAGVASPWWAAPARTVSGGEFPRCQRAHFSV